MEKKILKILPVFMMLVWAISLVYGACTVAINYPAASGTLTGVVTVNATVTACTNNQTVTNVSFYHYTTRTGIFSLIGTNNTLTNDNATNWAMSWNTAAVPDEYGPYTIWAYAYQNGTAVSLLTINGTDSNTGIEILNTVPTATMANTASSTVTKSTSITATLVRSRTCTFELSTDGGINFPMTRTGTYTSGNGTCSYSPQQGTDSNGVKYVRAKASDGTNTAYSSSIPLVFDIGHSSDGVGVQESVDLVKKDIGKSQDSNMIWVVLALCAAGIIFLQKKK